MSDKSKIEWTNASWNPATGCTKVSAGCKNCYMFREYPRLAKLGAKGYAGGTPDQVRLWPERLDQPLRWKKPRMVFVNSMSDLFHETIAGEFIDRALAVMAAARRHTFQILTKRPKRMLECLHNPAMGTYIWDLANRTHGPFMAKQWPLPNVWLGVSVEDQKTADERIPLLLQTPAAVRFVSYEPALGPVDFSRWTEDGLECSSCEWTGTEPKAIHDHGSGDDCHFDCPMCGEICAHTPLNELLGSGLHWVIAGGESGPQARPSQPDWFRSVRDQCVAAGVPFFFKQWGEWVPNIQSIPNLDRMIKVGKKRAGRLLDGREWNEFPAGN